MIELDRIETSLLDRAGDRPSDLALADDDERWTFERLAEASHGFARRLAALGVEPGSRVVVYLDKSLAAVEALYGVWMAGAIAVPAHPALKAAQLRHLVEHSGARVLVSHRRKLARLDDVPEVTIYEVTDPPTAQANPGAATGGETPAIILYTSGSTGRPKGICVSHENLRAGARIVSRYLEIQADERILSVLPFNFDYGLNQLLSAVHCGGSLHLVRSAFPGDVCRALQRHEITGFAAVPPLWIQLMQPGSPFTEESFPSLRYMTNTGGAFPVELVRRYREHLPHVRLYLMYGLSEAFRSTYLPPTEVDRIPESMGRAIPETDVWVLDDDDQRCSPGEVGQLVHRGPTVALGYWNDPDATARSFRPNPFDPESDERVVYSGDLVRADDDGFLYFMGRRDAMIKCQGVRVSPEEVEEIVYDSELVAEVAATGVPDPSSGQAIVLHVVPREDRPFDEAVLRNHCRQKMPPYMLPREVRTHASLPRTGSGKIDRKALS